MTYTGSCACGAITLSITGEVIASRQCWCRQCQQIASGGPTNNATFPTENVRIDGDVASGTFTAASGSTVTQAFCPKCGVHLYGQSSARPHLLSVRLGALDERHGIEPTMAIWTDDAPDWALIDPKLENVARQPAPPKMD